MYIHVCERQNLIWILNKFLQLEILSRVGSEQYLAGNIDGGQKITEV